MKTAPISETLPHLILSNVTFSVMAAHSLTCRFHDQKQAQSGTTILWPFSEEDLFPSSSVSLHPPSFYTPPHFPSQVLCAETPQQTTEGVYRVPTTGQQTGTTWVGWISAAAAQRSMNTLRKGKPRLLPRHMVTDVKEEKTKITQAGCPPSHNKSLFRMYLLYICL